MNSSAADHQPMMRELSTSSRATPAPGQQPRLPRIGDKGASGPGADFDRDHVRTTTQKAPDVMAVVERLRALEARRAMPDRPPVDLQAVAGVREEMERRPGGFGRQIERMAEKHITVAGVGGGPRPNGGGGLGGFFHGRGR